MATDVARLSFDPARGYRGVIGQQGRVSLEAEQNEQRVIDVEERRHELIDIVGPVGTPDNGYVVSGSAGSSSAGSSSGAFEITVGAGTMYVGGWRLELEQDLGDYDQPDWLDRGGDWLEAGREHVVLLVEETDVSAVEDPALYEVALGGPDGAARSRLLQRIIRLRTDAETCSAAMVEDIRRWRRSGASFEPDTMALESNSRLQVSWEGDPEPVNPCEPSSTGGYLGAENQLIRVQLTRIGRDGAFDFLWGYDDASFLYRVTADASDKPVLTLDRTPVDDYHRPRAGQAVQALRATAELPGGDGVIEGYVAALTGEVGVLATPYDPDTKTVQFPAALPADYTDPDENPQLFLRIWEELVTDAEIGKPISLTGTGMRITITSADEDRLQEGDFWCVGVRPSTPTTVYPERYLRAPQPPDGPRRWVCPLAVIEWTSDGERRPENEKQDGRLVVLEDCRRHFKPLTDLESDGCCEIEVHPSDASSGRLQELIDRVATGRKTAHRDSHITICFAPGRYELRRPLILRRWHSNMTLRGCSEAAVIAAYPDAIEEFGHGLVILADADNVTITGFQFVLPQVPSALAKQQASTGGLFDRAAARAVNDLAGGRYLSIGIQPVNCAVLEIDDCLFRYSLGEHETTPEVEQTMPRAVFGVGVMLSGGSWGLRVLNNRFLHHGSALVEDREMMHLLVGLLQVPRVITGSRGEKSSGRLSSARLPTLIEDALISDNEFDGVSAGVVLMAEIGSLRVRDNVVCNANQGLMILDEQESSSTDFDGEHEIKSGSEEVRRLHASLASGLFDPVLAQLLVLSATLPLPNLPGFEPAGVRTVDLEDLEGLRAQATEDQRTMTARTVARLSAEHPTVARAADAQDTGPTGRAGKARDAKLAAAKPAAIGFTLKASDIAKSTGLSTGMLSAVRRLSEFSRIAGVNSTLRAAITVEHNTVDCTVPNNGRTGYALHLVMQRNEGFGPSATISSNRLTAERSSVIVGIGGLESMTLTGNIIGTRSSQEYGAGLAVGNVEEIAVTGNVVYGGAILPANRPFPAPLDTWLPLNTIL